MSKTLYVLTSDCGDGTRSVSYTFDESWIKRQKERYDNDELDYDSIGCHSDGFHYGTLTVPDECTYESLGINYPLERYDGTY